LSGAQPPIEFFGTVGDVPVTMDDEAAVADGHDLSFSGSPQPAVSD
jgi:hypothetical protein